VAVARGNEKGRVARAIRYIRDNFFVARAWQDLDDLNAQADEGCQGVRAERRCPEHHDLSVRDAFGQEQSTLLPLPDNAFNTHEQRAVYARKTPDIRFHLNDYAIPPTQVQKTLTGNADLTQGRLFDGTERIAEHRRRFAKGEQIEQEAHINALWLSKTKARLHRGQDRLSNASPLTQTRLAPAIERGH